MKNLSISLSIVFLALISLGFQSNCETHKKAKIESAEIENQLPKDWEEGKTKCPLHGEVLKKEEIQIIYGVISLPPDYYKVKKDLFPFNNSFQFGGMMREGVPKKALVAYCDKCRAAARKWLEENKGKSVPI